jgi:hypothetical protein
MLLVISPSCFAATVKLKSLVQAHVKIQHNTTLQSLDMENTLRSKSV